ncbi:MAG: tRNA (N(6)-L-threonylcarbamoyladenosine(37)-C(2))-methylthiotransferase MtaB [Syntrophobacterales bacterium]|jgi:threonylcarbamoyladenosine tRNA methylthiotransferase MtaB
MSTIALATLGCKVNQCESAYLEEELTQADFLIRPFTGRADLYCINTCAVTSRAAMQSRQLIRRARRQNPEAEVVVMGCYAQIAAEEIAAIPGVTHILGTTEKLSLLDYLAHPEQNQPPYVQVNDVRTAPAPQPLVFSGFSHRTRAFLKVQDGCDAFCSYCIVPYARGRSRSISLESVLSQVARFLDHGYQEVVLTGIHLGQWGLNFNPRQDLIDLLRSIIKHRPPPRLRLSSLEPGEITSDLLDLIATEPSLCPHLHIPLQSGDATILARMNRHYHPDLYRDLVLEATQRIPYLAVGADVLVGFPGETDACFQNSYRLIESLPIAYLHVFPYSPRPTTPAATMSDQVSPAVIRQRSGLLRELDLEKRLAFLQRFLGEMQQVLVENRWDEASSMQCGFTDNYLPVLVPADASLENQIIMARMDRLEGNRLVAIPV